jgi:hypothetical protein
MYAGKFRIARHPVSGIPEAVLHDTLPLRTCLQSPFCVFWYCDLPELRVPALACLRIGDIGIRIFPEHE